MTSKQQASNMLQRIVGVFSRLTDSCRSSAQAQREPRLINVETPHGNLRFVATSDIEQWRATSLLHKEAGTVAWISRSVGPGDVFYDVGANIGIYSLLAALCAGPAGRVFAFEPHLLNCSRTQIAWSLGVNRGGTGATSGRATRATRPADVTR